MPNKIIEFAEDLSEVIFAQIEQNPLLNFDLDTYSLDMQCLRNLSPEANTPNY